ncbi:MAG: hypothetical protein Aurels2KO_01760 [Aureliella sp.]
MFNSVEGNSCFYATPTPEQAARWAAQSLDGFQFCLKFPRAISHDRGLVGAQQETREFLDAVEVLAEADRLGPSFLQLGPDFSPRYFSVLESYLRGLPRDLPWAVEVRHQEWFDQSDAENRLNDLLRDLAVDKVLFDSRAIFRLPATDESEAKAQSRKPKTPVRQTVTGQRPLLRLIGRNTPEQARREVDQWAKIVAGWIRDSLKPCVFLHAPHDRFAPQLVRMFYDALSLQLDPSPPPLPRLPETPMLF